MIRPRTLGSIALLIACAAAFLGPQPVAAQNGGSISGTRWHSEINYSDGSKPTVEFLTDGRVLWNNRDRGGKWGQENSRVWFNPADGAGVWYELTLQGDRLVGSENLLGGAISGDGTDGQDGRVRLSFRLIR